MRHTLILRASLLAAMATGLSEALAGGSGLNVAIVVNETSSNSVQLGNYYAERRDVPSQNVVRINWPGGPLEWSLSEFQTVLFAPLTNALATRSLTNQIDYVVLSMDIPYKVTASNGVNSTTSVLFYGFKTDNDAGPNLPDSCSLPAASTSEYAGSETAFRDTPPGTLPNTFLATMITASNLNSAKRIVDQGVTGDATHPGQPVLLAKSTDVFRNIRFYSFDNTVFDARVLGRPTILRTNLNSPFGQLNLLGWQHGTQNFSVSSSNTFIPGAMADHLTSFGGSLFLEQFHEHTTLLKFIDAGAAGAYGTIVEPCAHLEKFPSPQNYFYQARGFSLAECYYQSVTNPYQGLLVGEPLSAPFRVSTDGDWLELPGGSALSGTTNLSVNFSAVDSTHPIQQIDLYLDGRFVQTLTNISPRRFNTLHVRIDNHAMSYTVPNNATLQSVANGLAEVLNQPGNQNQTSVRASTHGDRIELQALDAADEGAAIPVTVSNVVGSASALTTFITAAQPAMLDSSAHGLRSWKVTGTNLLLASLELIVTKTNGQQITLTTTNNAGSLGSLAQQIVDGVNGTNALQGPDGLVAEDFIDSGTQVTFNLRARSPGIRAAQIEAQLSAIGTLVVEPLGSGSLDENLSDLRPRNHLYLSSGITNLPFTFSFDSTEHADGWHQLTAIAYEGTHVRTQTRIDRTVRIQNSPLTATISTTPGATNVALEVTIEFEVTANTNTVATTELFSTGGSLGVVNGQTAAQFSVPGDYLGPGLHPFHALVTTTDGLQYQTETLHLRLVEIEDPFPLIQTSSPLSVTWNAVGGRSYDVLSSDNLESPFQLRESVVPPSGGPFIWTDPSPASDQRFYQVRTTPLP